jgi:hypothetical protein
MVAALKGGDQERGDGQEVAAASEGGGQDGCDNP